MHWDYFPLFKIRNSLWIETKFMQNTNETYSSETKTVDIHHHILPPVYVKALEGSESADHFRVEQGMWVPQASLDFMENHEISKAVLSVPDPGTHFDDRDLACYLARNCNEYGAGMIQDHPGKFAALASLPLPNVDDALKELEYAIDSLNLSGVILMSNINGIYLGDPCLESLFSEFNRRNLLVFLHPNRCPYGPTFNSFAEYPLDVTRAVANLMYHGIFERFPRIRFILGHIGGALPYLAIRIFSVTYTYASGRKEETLNFNPLKWIPALFRRKALLKNMYFDITCSVNPVNLSVLPEITKPTHILMGTDFPWSSQFNVRKGYQSLDHIPTFDERESCQIKGENAVNLFF